MPHPELDALRFEAAAQSAEAGELLVGEERVWIVGGGEVGVETDQSQRRQRPETADDRARFLVRGAVAGDARCRL